MKNKPIEKNESMVKLLRDIRDKMNIEIADMTTEELKDYFKKKRQKYLLDDKPGLKEKV